MYCSRDYYYSSRFNQQYEKLTPTLDIDFGICPDVLKSKYLDMYEDVYTEMVHDNKFNEHSDLRLNILGTDKNDERH